MKKTLGIAIGTLIVCLTFMVEGAIIALGAVSHGGVSFELPTGISIETEGHEFELVGR